VQLGASPEQIRAATSDGWVLVTDGNRPLGWVEPSRVDRDLQPEMVHRGGTVASVSGPLRNALDAALSSPSRRGVIVDGDGALLGTVRAHEVLNAIEEVDRPAVHQEDLQPVEPPS